VTQPADNTPTCGTGLAAHAPLPEKLGALTAAVADVLRVHMNALDLTDPRARQEHAAYGRLVADHRAAAGQLAAIAQQLRGARDLPMGRHDAAAMAAAEVLESFRAFVELEQELVALLEERLAGDREMLAAIAATGH
jgi:hypothetical protein